MAEPAAGGAESIRVVREIAVSRLERQLLVKAYDLLVPSTVSSRSSTGVRDGARSRNSSRMRSKGVRS